MRSQHVHGPETVIDISSFIQPTLNNILIYNILQRFNAKKHGLHILIQTGVSNCSLFCSIWLKPILWLG